MNLLTRETFVNGKLRICLALSLTVVIGSLAACKVSADALAASQQMRATAEGLDNYYATLDFSVADTVALYELDGATSGIPYGSEDRRQQMAVRAELARRKTMAEALARLASSMAALAGTKAAPDVERAATDLGHELVTIKALPGGSPVPDAIGKAGNLLLQMIQQHEEKKAAIAMDDTLHAVGDLFEKEKPVYDSIARSHDLEASQVAKDLIVADAIDPSPMLAPALRPFGLEPLPPSPALRASLKALALSRLESATREKTQREEAASTAMLAALREMSTRVHQLAQNKPMPLRNEPFSLKAVQDWAQSWVAAAI